MHKHFSRIAPALLGLALGLTMASNASAETVTGQITVTLKLTNACQVNGAGIGFGTLDFGSKTSLFTMADGQVLGGGGGALSILCSSGTNPKVKVSTGTNDEQLPGGSRALTDGSNLVPYNLYTNASHTMLLAINDVITLPTSTGVAQTVEIYGQATGVAGLPAGSYTDTVLVELAF